MYSTLGIAYLRKGTLAKAEELFLKSIEIDPKHTEALLQLGEICRKRQDLDGAIAYLERAKDASPGFADVRYRLGEAYLGRDEADRAIAEFEGALRINANFVEARIAASFALRRLGREDEALRQIDQVLAIDPHNVIALAEKQSFVIDKPATGKQSVQ
jgi:tetratricopeptide (TPR) repeat protein